MKIFTLSAAIGLLSFGIATAQNVMPDSSFENWHTGKYGYLDPDGCDTTYITNSNYYNAYDSASVLQTTDAHSGTYALKIRTVRYGNNTTPVYEGGYIDFFFPVTYKPEYFSGWWIGNEGSVKFSQGTASINIYDSTGTGVIGGCTVSTYGDTAKWSTYKSFTGYITYVSHTAPAKYCQLKLFVTNQGNDSVPWVAFDDISINTLSGINAVTGSASYNLQVYPNPAANTAQVTYTLKNSGNVLLTLTDMLGRTVQPLTNSYRAPGSYSLALDCSALSAGLYFCKLTTSTGCEVTKLLVSK